MFILQELFKKFVAWQLATTDVQPLAMGLTFS